MKTNFFIPVPIGKYGNGKRFSALELLLIGIFTHLPYPPKLKTIYLWLKEHPSTIKRAIRRLRENGVLPQTSTVNKRRELIVGLVENVAFKRSQKVSLTRKDWEARRRLLEKQKAIILGDKFKLQ